MITSTLTWKKIDANTRQAIGPDGTVEGLTVKSEGTFVGTSITKGSHNEATRTDRQ